MSEKTDDTFIGRWSRLKRAGGADATAVVSKQPVETQAAAEGAVEDEAQQALLAANRAAAEAVDIEAIGYETDISVFFKEGVPALLKQAAMRRMWRSNPIFANVDGLNDYDHDYNVIDRVLTEFKSAWQAGRGYLPKLVEPAEPVEATAAGPVEPHRRESTNAAVDGERRENAEIEPLAPENDADSVPPTGQTPAVAGPVEMEMPAETAETAHAAPLNEEARPMVSLRRRMAQFNES